MRKILTIIIMIVVASSGLQVLALPQAADTPSSKTLSISFSTPTMIQQDEYIIIDLDQRSSYLMDPGKPMMPIVSQVIDIPFGATNIKVTCRVTEGTEHVLSQPIKPASEPYILDAQQPMNTQTTIDEQVYQQTEMYPHSWYGYRIGCGLSNGKHVTHVAIQFHPIRYTPATQTITTLDSAQITVTYEQPPNPIIFGDAYDLVIITPQKFSRLLNRLVTHKEDLGIPTIIKTVEEITDEYDGFDQPEQIKYFIKDAIEDWGVSHVLLVGGLKSYYNNTDRDNCNEGSTDWYVPVRYTNLYDDDEITFDPGTISDLYYADIYKTGAVFDSWDSNGDGIYAAWDKPGVGNDVLDLYPDVCVGRLPCRNRLEVLVMVNKIINYETTAVDPSWFNRIVCMAGDSFESDYEYEGELLCDTIIDMLPDFDPVKIYASNKDTGTGLTPSPENFTLEVSLGCGLLSLEGHGTPGSWVTHYPGGIEWTPALLYIHFIKLSNRGRLPVCVVGGCHDGLFNVSWAKTTGPGNASYWSLGNPIPECLSWWLTRKVGGGSIATIGCTGLSYGILDSIGYSAYLDAMFFYVYSELETPLLGYTWIDAINTYIYDFGYLFTKIDAKTIQVWELFGDPSLMIGGYE